MTSSNEGASGRPQSERDPILADATPNPTPLRNDAEFAHHADENAVYLSYGAQGPLTGVPP
ncbi:MAG TPA: hypothetical protein VGG82_08375 [Casimicrobiaceae bacterium]|jgi:hypothetical protein